MRRGFTLKAALLLAFALGELGAVSCQESGVTSSCPALPLYSRAPVAGAQSADSAAVQSELARAQDAGCITAPTTFASEAGMAGEPLGEGGSAGSGIGGVGSDGVAGVGRIAGATGIAGVSGVGGTRAGGVSGVGGAVGAGGAGGIGGSTAGAAGHL